ncbi:DNA-binding phosphoprotein [Equine parapoxvirus]|nr:DNA-binding phosphoprotein [Equine parapoxvirus]WOC29291.1 DNA-binding phosphoprotein [Equine parapoxvirus]WOC29299.1 DNA-binding phosphoprotein [Equine parapoxvirus]
MSGNGEVQRAPFIVNVRGVGRVLVLKHVVLCHVREMECDAPAPPCALKADKPAPCPRPGALPLSPPCPLPAPACPRSPFSPGAMGPMMRTNLLESLFTKAKSTSEQALCART